MAAMQTRTMPARQERKTDLEFLRLGAIGKPRQVDIARRMKSSRTTISLFESGAREASAEFIRAYAKAVQAPVKEVERRYWETRAAYCLAVAQEARERLRVFEGA